MPVDEFHLRNQARELADLYRQLHELKHTHPTPPEVSTNHQPPGPKTPGNWLIIATYTDLEQRLREVAFNAFADTHITLRDGDAAAPRLCHLLAFHAYTVSRLDWAEDLLDDLGDIIATTPRGLLCVQVKDVASPQWKTWFQQLENQVATLKANTTKPVIGGILIWKTRGSANPAKWRVVCQILRATQEQKEPTLTKPRH